MSLLRHHLRSIVSAAGGTLGRANAHARLLAVASNGITDLTLEPHLTIHPALDIAAPMMAHLQGVFQAIGVAGYATVVAVETGKDPVVVDAIAPPPHGVVARIRATSSGRIHQVTGEGLRIRSGEQVVAGRLLAQIHAVDLDSCAARVKELSLPGITSDQELVLALLLDPRVQRGHATPALRVQQPRDPDLLVILPGLQTTVQSWPGRVGLWHVGVPPSGPMDSRSLLLANRCVGNPPQAAGLEIAMQGPRLRVGRTLTMALTGAMIQATCQGKSIQPYQPFTVHAGQELVFGGIAGAGARAYLAVRGGFAVPTYLDSTATFTLGGFGGHNGRALIAGDALTVEGSHIDKPFIEDSNRLATPIPISEQPTIGKVWHIGVLEGPHLDTEFLTEAGRRELFAATWTVSPQSSRTGVRLLGPVPRWARADGGEAGLHPSNIHDTAYSFAAIDLTGDTPIILGPDGPSTGGFVCPCVVAVGERWKLGQLRAGDAVHLVPITPHEAQRLRQGAATPDQPEPAPTQQNPLLFQGLAGDGSTRMHVRRAGDDFMLCEYGPMALDLEIRLRVHLLHQAICQRNIPGIIDLVPAVRSLQIHYDPHRLTEDFLVDSLRGIDRELPTMPDAVPSRIVNLPLSWDDPSTRKAIEIYMRTVNPTAPWCPWNIEFIRRINGLTSVQAVQDLVFSSEYLVLGLGDVYLGAPVAVPVDPRHRLVTTKYNPARTWTPENAVGIGGAYMCIYGMEGPGGYQFIGRTVPVWAPFRQEGAFQANVPWLLRPFDRIRFYPVSASDLERQRADAPRCHGAIRIEDGAFDLQAHRRLLVKESASITAFTQHRDSAFAQERQRWAEQASK